MNSHAIVSKARLVALLVCCTLVLADHYQTLGLSKDATEKDIKKSYRRLALKFHPDKAKSAKDKAAAEAQFAKIGEAYEVLKDPKTRAEYDQSLSQPKGQRGFGGASRGFGGAEFFEATGSPGGAQFHFRGPVPSMFDFLDPSMFTAGASGAGFSSMFGQQHQRPTQPPVNLYPADMLLTAGKMRRVTRPARGDEVWLLHFFTQSSRGCKQLATSLKRVRESLQGMARIAAVDCDSEQSLCEAQQVSQFPLVKLLSSAPGVKQLSAAEQLSEKALTAAALEALPSHVVDLRRPGHTEQFYGICRTQATRGCVLLFTEKYEIAPLYKRLSSVFKGQLLLGIVRGAHNSLLAQDLGVERFPTLLYQRSPSAQATKYTGPIKYNQIRAFLQQAR